jgi:hypothetical protein
MVPAGGIELEDRIENGQLIHFIGRQKRMIPQISAQLERIWNMKIIRFFVAPVLFCTLRS